MVSGWATDSRVLYTMLVALVAAERLVELLVSRRNLARARSRGGVVESRRSYLTVAVFHAALLLACPVEVWALDRQWWPPLGVPMLGVLAATMGLRYWVIATLGESWNVRVVVVPGDPPVTRGPFRYVRHPNYLAVALEVPALALVHGAWLVGAGFGLANLLVLARRIGTEEELMRRHMPYDDVMRGRPRFLPSWSHRALSRRCGHLQGDEHTITGDPQAPETASQVERHACD